VLTTLSVVRPFDREVTHLSFDDAWIGTISAWRIDLIGDLGKHQRIMVIIMREGENAPASRPWTG
jgi:hypothetical protein